MMHMRRNRKPTNFGVSPPLISYYEKNVSFSWAVFACLESLRCKLAKSAPTPTNPQNDDELLVRASAVLKSQGHRKLAPWGQRGRPNARNGENGDIQ